MICSHCNGTVIREDDPYDGSRMVCLQCGRSPAITPIGNWLLEAERRRDVRPTEQYWKMRKGKKGIPPATRVYD